MAETLLEIKGLRVKADGREILRGIDLTVGRGEAHVLMGPNGAGKSTLVGAVMGNPKFQVLGGSMEFEGEDISALPADERARRGIFMSFQNPEEIPGVTVENFLRTARTAVTKKPLKLFAFKKELAERMEELQIDASYASRYLNVGFSGGEKKKNEILQLLMMDPKLAILDETDSGLDVDAVRVVSEGISRFRNNGNSLLIITHNTNILSKIKADVVHVLVDGRVVKTAGPELIEEIGRSGFAAYERQNAVG